MAQQVKSTHRILALTHMIHVWAHTHPREIRKLRDNGPFLASQQLLGGAVQGGLVTESTCRFLRERESPKRCTRYSFLFHD